MRKQLIATCILISSVGANAQEISASHISPQTAIELHRVSTMALRNMQSADSRLLAEAETENRSDSSASAGGNTHSIITRVTKFAPMVLFIEPGDTVTWSNMAGHDTASIDGMIPAGAASWQSKMGETYSHTFTQQGAYLYKCNPHVSMDMIGAIVVGNPNPSNLPGIEKHPENKGMVGRAVRILKKELAKK